MQWKHIVSWKGRNLTGTDPSHGVRIKRDCREEMQLIITHYDYEGAGKVNRTL